MNDDRTNGDQWIHIVGWDRFQHYKDRDPGWIKAYTSLLHKDEYLRLTGHQRGVLHGLWLEYASAHRQLRLNTRSLSRQLALRVTSHTIETLNHAGFIMISSSATRARETRARERGTSYPKESASAPTSPNGDVALALEEEKTLPPPDAVARVKALVDKVFEK